MNINFSQVFDELPDTYMLISTDLKILDINKQILALNNKRKEDFVGKNALDAFNSTENAKSEFKKSIEKVLETKKEHSMDPIRYDLPSEKEDEITAVYWQILNKPVLNEAGNVDFIITKSCEVTEKINAENSSNEHKKLIEYQTRLTKIITDNATVALFMMNAEGYCTFMNPEAERMTGFTLEEVQEKPLHYLIHHHRPDGSFYPMEECPIDKALPTNSDVRAHKDVFIHKNGTFYPVTCAASPVFENGVPVSTVIEVRDLTKEQEAQKALEDSEMRFRFMAEAMPSMVWMSKADGTAIFVSERWTRFTGIATEDMLVNGWHQAIHPDDLELAARRLQEAGLNGEDYQVEFRVRKHDGQYRWHLTRAFAKRNAQNEIEFWVGSSTDIHDQKKMVEELLENNEQMSEMTDQLQEALTKAESESKTLESMIMNAPAMICILRGKDHVFDIVNPEYQKLFSQRDIQGKPVIEALPEIKGQGFIELLDNVYNTGEPFFGKEVPVMIDMNNDGSMVPINVNFTYQPLYEGDIIIGVVVFALDVTELVELRKKCEEA